MDHSYGIVRNDATPRLQWAGGQHRANRVVLRHCSGASFACFGFGPVIYVIDRQGAVVAGKPKCAKVFAVLHLFA